MRWEDRIESKLDIIDAKLDEHLDRLSTAETEIHWLKGSVKWGITAAISILGTLGTFLFKMWEKL